jgi:predicted transcriptional regulator
MSRNFEIDNTDLRILEILMQDAKRPYTEVAKRVNVSQGTVHVRMNKMEDAGILEKTTLKSTMPNWVRHHRFYRYLSGKECFIRNGFSKT